MNADYHVHTYYSDDSECPMEVMIKEAISLGLDEIAFTEHVDYGVKTDLNCDYDAYFKEIGLLKERYADRITVRAGIEFGVQAHTVGQFQRDFERYPFEFIILSNHQVEDKEFWNMAFQEGKTQEEFQQAYYEAIYDVVRKYKNYSVLGHLDMIKRYDPYGSYPDEKIMDMVDRILRLVIADGKGIELNTSCFRYGLADLTPSRTILKRYLELGGQIITIGSDSHEARHLGGQIAGAKKILREIGFTKFCTFDKMEPVFWSL